MRICGKRICVLACAALAGLTGGRSLGAEEETGRAVLAGEPGVRPFWNGNAGRFIYAPAFEMGEVAGAVGYRFQVKTSRGEVREFTAGKPWASLAPVWEGVPEGVTEVTVEGVDAAGGVVGRAGRREFYRSPGFGGEVGEPVKPYAEAGRWALEAIYRAPQVQHWLVDGKPDRGYDLYCYPPKVMGALARAMVAYSKVTGSEEERGKAVEIARRVADHLISISAPGSAAYAYFPPTYTTDVDHPLKAAVNRTGKWLFVPAGVDAAMGYLDVYDATKDEKYLEAAKRVAGTYRKKQGEEGSWPVMVDPGTGEALRPNRQIPTWIIFLFDRLEKEYGVGDFKESRGRAWGWIEENPLKNYRWEGQFEDGTPREPYRNLAREQACDVAGMLLDRGGEEGMARAEELLRFAEDQFVVWGPIKDAAGWRRVMPTRRQPGETWITPCVMEQYGAYAPVARSSAILINTYLKAWRATGKEVYLRKARALGNGLVAAQAWMAERHGGKGEIPTWLTGHEPINWLNNSFYAAEAVRGLGEVGEGKK